MVPAVKTASIRAGIAATQQPILSLTLYMTARTALARIAALRSTLPSQPIHQFALVATKTLALVHRRDTLAHQIL